MLDDMTHRYRVEVTLCKPDVPKTSDVDPQTVALSRMTGGHRVKVEALHMPSPVPHPAKTVADSAADV
jgi:hypothetical protein